MREITPDGRPFSKLKLYIGEIGHNRKNDLMRVFDKYGSVRSLYVDELKKFGFVEFYSTRDATEALRKTDGKLLNGTRLRVEFARRDNRQTFRNASAERRPGNGVLAHRRRNEKRAHSPLRRRSPEPRSPRRRRPQNSKRSGSNTRRSMSPEVKSQQFPPQMSPFQGMLTPGSFIPPFPYAYDPYGSAAMQMGVPMTAPSAGNPMQGEAYSAGSHYTEPSNEDRGGSDRRKRRRTRNRSNGRTYADSVNEMSGSHNMHAPLTLDYAGRPDMDNHQPLNSAMMDREDDSRRGMPAPPPTLSAANMLGAQFLPPMFPTMYPGFLPIAPGAPFPPALANQAMMMLQSKSKEDRRRRLSGHRSHHRSRRHKHHDRRHCSRRSRRYRHDQQADAERQRNRRKQYREERPRRRRRQASNASVSSSSRSQSGSYDEDDGGSSNCEYSGNEEPEDGRRNAADEERSNDESSQAEDESSNGQSSDSNSQDEENDNRSPKCSAGDKIEPER